MANKHKKSKRVLQGILMSFVLVVIVLAIGFTWGGNRGIPKVNSQSGIFDKIRDTSLNGGKLIISKDDINYLIKFSVPDGLNKSNIYIKGAYTKLSNGSATVFVPISYKKIGFLLSAKVEVLYENNEVILNPSNFKIGVVPIPKSFIMGYLKKVNNEKIIITANTIVIKKSSIPFDFKSLAIIKDKVVLDLPKIDIAKGLEAIIDDESAKYKAPIKKNNNPKSSSTTKTNSNTKKNELGTSERNKILKSTSGQLNTAVGKVKTSTTRNIVVYAESTIKKMINNPGYKYQGDLLKVKTLYESLSPVEKESVKAAIFSNVDTKSLLKIYTNQK